MANVEDAQENYCKGGSTPTVLILTKSIASDLGIYGLCALIRLRNGICGAGPLNRRQFGLQLCVFEQHLENAGKTPLSRVCTNIPACLDEVTKGRVEVCVIC
jgi:hypothetical protein